MLIKFVGYCFGIGLVLLIVGAVVFKIVAEIRHNNRAKRLRKNIQDSVNHGNTIL